MCFISMIQLTVAQNYSHEFGKTDKAVLELQRYEKDTTAEAVVIYDIGQSSFVETEKSFDVIFERKMKIKIFTKAGLKWAEMSIPYYNEVFKHEDISSLKANTYNLENGKIRVSALASKNIYNEKGYENWYDRKFAFPDVKEGSVIEVSYKIRSPYLLNFRNWSFQKKIPVIYSEYTTKMIPFFKYNYILQGILTLDEFKKYTDNGLSRTLGTTEYHDLVYDFIMKDVPAFRDESYITSANDYMMKINFQLSTVHFPDGFIEAVLSTWPQLNEELIDNESFGKYLKSCKNRSTDILDTMHLASKPDLEKAKSIEHFVKSNFNWDGYSNKFTNKSVKDLLSSKTGNSAEINLFLAGMLNAAGIEAYPVITSTRSNGKIQSDYPFLHLFNYVVVLAKIDSVPVILDATEPLSNFAEIPTRSINDRGLVVQKKLVEWVDLKSSSVSRIVYKFDLQPDPENDSINQSCNLMTTGYEAIDYRNKFSTSYKALKTKLLTANALSSDTLSATNLNQIEMPFIIDFNKKAPLEKVEDKFLIAPFCNFTITENPLKQLVRNYPVDMIYRNSSNFQSTVTIPKGYKLLTKPEDLRINNDKIKIIFSTSLQEDNTIVVTGVYEFKKAEYETPEYFDLKDYFNKIVDKFNEKLVFVKV